MLSKPATIWCRVLLLVGLWFTHTAWAAGAVGPATDATVGPGDLLQIGVSGYPELSVNTRISSNGDITYPYVGSVAVKGMTTSQVESLLATRLTAGAFVRQPQVTVLVIEVQSQLVAVMGQVNKPGQYPLQASHKVLDLLAQAGGVVQGAVGGLVVNGTGVAGDDATLVRRDGTKVSISLPGLFSGDPTQNPSVAGGDSIYVPRAPQFYVYGEVTRPGVYKLERNMTVSQAISAGGGLSDRGSDRRIFVKRRGQDGTERQHKVHGGDLVQTDDVLLVKQSLF
jgi:polysaccharide export outer membrane protein